MIDFICYKAPRSVRYYIRLHTVTQINFYTFLSYLLRPTKSSPSCCMSAFVCGPSIYTCFPLSLTWRKAVSENSFPRCDVPQCSESPRPTGGHPSVATINLCFLKNRDKTSVRRHEAVAATAH